MISAAGLLLSSLAFAFYHLIDPSIGFLFVVPTIVAGFLFGMAYLWAGLAGSTLSHGGYNAAIVLLSMTAL